MRQSVKSFPLVLAAMLTACTAASVQAPHTGSLNLRDAGPWPRLEASQSLGQATGIDVGRDGKFYIFHRASRKWIEPFPTEPIGEDTIAVADADGRMIASWGKNLFIMPHGLSLDSAGNVWVTDVGAHQVRQFSPSGRLLLTLGEFRKPGNDPTHFNRPTDVAFGPDGTVYVSDGYENTRVVRFSPQGRYLGEWGTPGKGHGQFDLPHGIAVDRKGRVYVADRENFRLQIFDANGRYLTEWGTDRLGDPYGVTVAHDGSIYVIDGGFQPDRTTARVIHLTATGRVIGTFTAATATDADVLGHDIAIGPDGTVYVADAWANRIRKLSIRR